MYKILDCKFAETNSGEALFEVHNHFRVGNIRLWEAGRKHKTVVPEPIHIEFEPLRGYQGLPMEYLDLGIPIMSERLSAALLASGVDNIDFYDAILTNSSTGETYQYKAFNIIGKIAMADLAASDYIGYDQKLVANVGFKNLVVDEAKAKNLLMFRLAENINAVMIHEKVRKYLLNAGIDTLTFIEPENWVQI
ncbi:MAG: hypothetical protein GXP10_04440 [Gammaproteobacteria bacterium]|nr:hypothetical protein [Gammaproteobacteria bacterium]